MFGGHLPKGEGRELGKQDTDKHFKITVGDKENLRIKAPANLLDIREVELESTPITVQWDNSEDIHHKCGDIVGHSQYGSGIIKSIDKKRVTVVFATTTKTILKNHLNCPTFREQREEVSFRHLIPRKIDGEDISVAMTRRLWTAYETAPTREEKASLFDIYHKTRFACLFPPTGRKSKELIRTRTFSMEALSVRYSLQKRIRKGYTHTFLETITNADLRRLNPADQLIALAGEPKGEAPDLLTKAIFSPAVEEILSQDRGGYENFKRKVYCKSTEEMAKINYNRLVKEEKGQFQLLQLEAFDILNRHLGLFYKEIYRLTRHATTMPERRLFALSFFPRPYFRHLIPYDEPVIAGFVTKMDVHTRCIFLLSVLFKFKHVPGCDKASVRFPLEAYISRGLLDKIPNDIKGNLSYDLDKELLIYKGVLSEDDRDYLFKLSTDDLYRKKIDELFGRSRDILKRELMGRWRAYLGFSSLWLSMTRQDEKDNSRRGRFRVVSPVAQRKRVEDENDVTTETDIRKTHEIIEDPKGKPEEETDGEMGGSIDSQKRDDTITEVSLDTPVGEGDSKTKFVNTLGPCRRLGDLREFEEGLISRMKKDKQAMRQVEKLIDSCLTKRQAEVCRDYIQGKRLRQIAEEREITFQAAHATLKRAVSRLQAGAQTMKNFYDLVLPD